MMRSLLFPFVVIVALQSFLAAQDVPAALKPYLMAKTTFLCSIHPLRLE